MMNRLNESSVAFVMAQTALLNCRVAGMVAENQHCTNNGRGLAYTDAEFWKVEREFNALIGPDAIERLSHA